MSIFKASAKFDCKEKPANNWLVRIARIHLYYQLTPPDYSCLPSQTTIINIFIAGIQ